MTPAADYRHAEQTVTAISKMMLTLPSREAGDLAAEAKSEAYMAALDDVPAWAVQEAMRKWYRGECGPDHDYRWQPGSAALRKIALAEFYAVKYVKTRLEKLLEAEALQEFSADHTEDMKRRVAELGISPRKAHPMNVNTRAEEGVNS